MTATARRALFYTLLAFGASLHAARACDCPEQHARPAALRSQVGAALIGDEERRSDPYRDLKLPKDRAEKLRKLLDRARRENRQLSERLEERRKELYREYRAYRYDARRCRRLMDEIRETQDQLIELHHRFQDDLRAHLTASEFETLQKKMEERRRRDDDER